MSRSLLRWVLVLSFACGCATTGRYDFEPTNATDLGPWPLMSHQTGLYKHWLSAGRYRTSDLGALAGNLRTDRKIVQISSYADVKITSQHTIDDANGRQVLVELAGKPCDKNLQLGSLKIPISNGGYILGLLSRDGQTFADFECRIDGPDFGTVHVGSKTLDIKLRESQKSGLDEFFHPERTIDFVLDGEAVGSLHRVPKNSVWLKPELDEDTRVTIMATIVTYYEAALVAERAASANNAAMSSARLSATMR